MCSTIPSSHFSLFILILIFLKKEMNDEKVRNCSNYSNEPRMPWMLVADFWFSPSFACIASVALLVANYMLLKCHEFKFNVLAWMWIIITCAKQISGLFKLEAINIYREFSSTKLALLACRHLQMIFKHLINKRKKLEK